MSAWSVTFTVDGTPVAKGRPRFARRGVHVHTFTPGETVAFERRVHASAATVFAGPVPAGLVRLTVHAVWPALKSKPAGMPRAEWAAGHPKATKPDLDNVVKSIMDGLQLAEWLDDDARVVELVATKRHAAHGEAAHTLVTVEVLGA